MGGFRRLNLDASWWLDLGGRVVFDPWLVGSEVDYARGFNEAWHTGPVCPPEEAPGHDLVVISQHYADHCHPETLRALPAHVPVAAVPQALARLAREVPERPLLALPPWGAEPLAHAGLRLWRLSRPWWHPPRYHAVVVADAHGRAAVHAPHGLPEAVARQVAETLDVVLLAVSRVHYRLPLVLGGSVNPGPEAADGAVRGAAPAVAFPIHDEAKRARGLVSRLARVRRAPLPASGPWRAVEHLEPVPLPAG